MKITLNFKITNKANLSNIASRLALKNELTNIKFVYSTLNLYTHHSSYFSSGRSNELGKCATFGELGKP